MSDEGITLKQQETHGFTLSTVAIDALVLRNQAISIHNAVWILYWTSFIQKYSVKGMSMLEKKWKLKYTQLFKG